MIIFTVILIIGYIAVLSFHFNNKNKDNLQLTNILFSIMDTVIVVSILYLSILSGYVFEFFTIFIVFFLLLGLLFFRVQNGDLVMDNYDLKFEAFKNTLIIFTLTLYPFFISLTMFRYLPWIIQILLSILFVVIIQYGKKYVRIGYRKVIRYFEFKIRFDGIRRFLYVWGIFGLVMVMMFLFNIPRNQINNVLNFNNHRPIFNFTKGYPIDLQTNYEAELVDEYTSLTPVILSYPAMSDEGVSRHGDLDIFNMRVFHDSINNLTYTSYVVNSDFTVYIKEDQFGNEEIYEIDGTHNTNGYVVGDVIYLTSQGSEVIEVMDGEFRINGIYNLQPTIPFFEGNSFSYFEFQGASKTSNGITFTTHEERKGVHYYKEYILEKVDIDMKLPFYSHYSYGAIVIVFIVMFIPITDYKKHITIVDMHSKLGIKKDD